MQTADLTGISRHLFGPVNYRPLKELGSPGVIAEPSNHCNCLVRIRVAIPAQLRAEEMLLDPKSMRLSDTAYASKVSGRCEIRRRIWSVKVGKCSGRLLSLRSDPGAARVVIVADSDFA